jgi:poly(hydroxyalkanoate) depolymerase family esterase
MSPIDWRELYASNRAAIAQAGAPSGTLSVPGVPDSLGTLRSDAGGSRRALVHAPAGAEPGTTLALVCMLHGCTQDAASFAAATRMNEASDRHGFVAVYPQQDRGRNPQGCWNWFLPEHQTRGAGEPRSIVESMRELVATASPWTIDPSRIFVAGLSAGGAMAAILAAVYPDVFAAVAVHSGLAYRSAATVRSAFAAMARGGEDPTTQGSAMHAAMGDLARPVPSMVVHGAADQTVAPVNADQILQQSMTANRLAAPEARAFDFDRPTDVSRGRVSGGHAYTSSQWADRDGVVMHELLKVDGLGHAWSGGAAGGSHADPRGPDATEAIWRFFRRASEDRPPALPAARRDR